MIDREPAYDIGVVVPHSEHKRIEAILTAAEGLLRNERDLNLIMLRQDLMSDLRRAWEMGK